jgi:hypothetical protein
MYHVLLVFLGAMAGCFVVGYITGLRSGIRRAMPVSLVVVLSDTPFGAPASREPQLFYDLDGGSAAGSVFWLHVRRRRSAEANKLFQAAAISFPHSEGAFAAIYNGEDSTHGRSFRTLRADPGHTVARFQSPKIGAVQRFFGIVALFNFGRHL